MAVYYAFRHSPSGYIVTIRSEWSRVGNRDFVLDDVEAHANKVCEDDEAFNIIGCVQSEPFPDEDNWELELRGEALDSLPNRWSYDLWKPSMRNRLAKLDGLKAVPEKEVDRNEFKRQGLL